MTPEGSNRWQRLQALFREASSLSDEEREAFLAEACEPDLREELQRLLQANANPQFMRSGALADTLTPMSPGSPFSGRDQLPGTEIGPYRIVEILGQGGMGTVYRAEQLDPVRRQVALKLIRQGMDNQEVIARFEAERQALALMNHPSIAQVFDAGMTDDLRPYFVMEYVEGVPITEYCDRHQLHLKERLRLFIEVCEGVHHAHQKGIIHRDIKPSNVLVTRQGDRTVPKIIDFGVAKAVSTNLLAEPMLTLRGQLIGTPEYMSPEQADPHATDIDTRSDIYSLGVLLYVLIVGEHPYASDSWRKAVLGEIQKIICEGETPRPSLRLSYLGEETRRAFSNRKEEASALVRKVRGELDWITMKALEKDRTRRYAAASDLAADVERYFKNEPVLAGPPSAVYRIKKLLRRHRGPFVTAIVALLALTVGLGGSSYLYLESNILAIARRGIDLQTVDVLVERADTLWPVTPALVPELDRWLADASTLQKRLPEYRRRLDELRRRALPYGPEDVARDRQEHTYVAHLDGARAELSDLREKEAEAGTPLALRLERELSIALKIDLNRLKGTGLSSPLDRIERLVEELAKSVDARRTWAFDDHELQTRHDWLSRLVERIETLEGSELVPGPAPSVRQRLQFATQIEERSMTGRRAAAAWRDLNQDLLTHPKYGGLQLEPQLGLLPLRRDPRSELWEFWHLQTGAEPTPNPDPQATNAWLLTEETGLVFVLMPGGSFRMGAMRPDEENELGDPNVDPFANKETEGPVHSVFVPPYFISKYEFTQGQWKRATGFNPSNYADDRIVAGNQHNLMHPVENFTQYECEKVLARLGLALPTDVQWEYAARGGTTMIWSTGNAKESLTGYANLSDKTLRESAGVTSRFEDWLDDDYGAHAPVGTFLPNPFGLHDVHGNLWEWTRAPLRYYEKELRVEDIPYCALRGGGSIFEPAEASRSANRIVARRDNPNFGWGFRPGREIDPK